MGTRFKHFSFSDDKTTFHYINPHCSAWKSPILEENWKARVLTDAPEKTVKTEKKTIFRIPGETESGNEFFLDGTMEQSDSHQFALKFQEAESEKSQTFFAYDVNLETGDVTQSSCAGEPIIFKGSRIFKPGTSFVMRITLGSDFYQVKINNEEPTVFKVQDKDAITKARFVNISGDAHIRSFHIQKNAIIEGEFHMSIPSNARVGDIYQFYGKALKKEDPKLASRITIDFADKPDGPEQNFICLHFNVRWNYGKETATVLNSHSDDVWGEREKHENPLTLGVPYKVDVVVEKEQFRIWVDEVEFCSFKHRLPFQGIAMINMFNTKTGSQEAEMMSVVLNRFSCRTPKSFGYSCSLSLEKAEKDCVKYFPKLPLNMTLPHKLTVGSCIYISGVCKSTSGGCSTFTCEVRSEKKDPILKIEADFTKKAVTILNKQLLSTLFPFKEKGYFQMQIFCADRNAMILSVDENLLDIAKSTSSDYNQASHVYVDGDVRISAIALLHSQSEKK